MARPPSIFLRGRLRSIFLAHSPDTTRGKKDFFRKLKSVLALSSQQRSRKDRRPDFIPIDAPIDLAYDNPVGELQAGDLFGEMTCMNYYPRSATVRAKTDCTALEMLRNVLDIMRRNKAFRARVEQGYRKRALESHLRGIPMFSTVTPEFIAICEIEWNCERILQDR